MQHRENIRDDQKTYHYLTKDMLYHVYGLAQACSNSIANALELLQSCAKPLMYTFQYHLEWNFLTGLGVVGFGYFIWMTGSIYVYI